MNTNDRNDDEQRAATRRVLATHLSMFSGSCVLRAVETWRMWNEFSDQRTSSEFSESLRHFGNDPSAVMDEISIVMSRLLASTTTPMHFDDAFILNELFAAGRAGSSSSNFLNTCVLSSLMVKFGESQVRTRYSPHLLHSSPYVSSSTGNACCSYCNSAAPMKDLGAYITRRRLQSL